LEAAPPPVVLPRKEVATPCRAKGDLGSVPFVDDATIPKPDPKKIRLSQDAIDARLRRIFRPNVSGAYKINGDILKQWQSKNKKSQQNIRQLFQSCGFSPDRVGNVSSFAFLL